MSIYRLYIDESGDHDYGKRTLKKLNIVRINSVATGDYPELNQVSKRYLGLTGCILNRDNEMGFIQGMDKIKQKHFGSNLVILHRKEIINKEGPFWRLRDATKEQAFNADILSFLKKQNYVVITVVLDKLAHILRYGTFAYHPYHYCLDAMLERYCGFLHFNNSIGDVMAESRGGMEDKKLGEAYQRIYESGNNFRKANFYQKVLTSKKIKIKPKIANIAAIQTADLLAFPTKQRILIDKKRAQEPDNIIFGKKICEVIKCKYNNNRGRIDGYGKVFLK